MARGPENKSHGMNIKTISLLIVISLFLKNQAAWAVITNAENCLLSSKVNQSEDTVVTPANIFRQSYDKAECLRRAAAAKGFEWLDTQGLLHQAQEEAEKANWETAERLVQKAQFQAEMSLRQAELEAEAWKRRVVD